jgi:probable F420-dependent oxidoreductase
VGGADVSSPTALANIARTVEEAGFDACFLTDHPFPTLGAPGAGHPTLDPLVTFGYLAALTRRIRMHVNLIVMPYRNPFLAASMAATLDHLSGGRLILGVGAGYLPGEAAALGFMEFERRNAVTEESIGAMRLAWTGQPVRGTGYQWHATGNTLLNLNASAPVVWMGGNSSSAMRIAASVCDGWQPTEISEQRASLIRTAPIVTLSDLRARIDEIREHREESDLKAPFDVCFVREPYWARQPRSILRHDIEQLEGIGVTWVAPRFEEPSIASFIDRVRRFREELGG